LIGIYETKTGGFSTSGFGRQILRQQMQITVHTIVISTTRIITIIMTSDAVEIAEVSSAFD